MIRRFAIIVIALGFASCRHAAPDLTPAAPQAAMPLPSERPRVSAPRAAGLVTGRVRFFLESPDVAAAPLALPQSGVRVAVGSEAVLTQADFVDVELVNAELGRCLLFHLTPTAAQRLDDLANSARGRRLVLSVNDVPLGARRIDQAVRQATLAIFVEVPDVYLPRVLLSMKPSARPAGLGSSLIDQK
jgi:hypothetical protein